MTKQEIFDMRTVNGKQARVGPQFPGPSVGLSETSVSVAAVGASMVSGYGDDDEEEDYRKLYEMQQKSARVEIEPSGSGKVTISAISDEHRVEST